MKLLAFVFFILLTSCGRGTKTESKNAEKKVFKSVYDTLDKIVLPVKWDPDVWSDLAEKHRDKYGMSGHDWEFHKHPYRILADRENFKAIVFFSQTETGSPIIMTIGKDLKPIDTLTLLGDWGGNDPSYGVSEIAEIESDLSIMLLDSISNWNLDSQGERIEDSHDLKIKLERFRILDNGKIKKTN